MEKIITYDTLRSFCYSSDKLVKGEIKGFVFSFMGLGGNVMLAEDPDTAVKLAADGYVYIIPYVNPWAWMNAQAIAYCDELIDVLTAHYGLKENVPVISTGGSMGGLSALVYTMYAKRTPVRCVANCPVCDLPYHYTERPDLPRTLYSAFGTEEGKLNEVLERYSPLHLADRLPRIPYYIFHCTADKSVNKGMHSDKLVKALREAGYEVDYTEIPDRGHCDLDEAGKARFESLLEL